MRRSHWEKVYGVLAVERVPLQSYDSGYQINQTIVPVSLGISYRSTGGRMGSYLDSLLAINPYKLQVYFAENAILDSWGRPTQALKWLQEPDTDEETVNLLVD